MHTGALGDGKNDPTAQQVPVLFSENATTTFGEVSNLCPAARHGCLIICSLERLRGGQRAAARKLEHSQRGMDAVVVLGNMADNHGCRYH